MSRLESILATENDMNLYQILLTQNRKPQLGFLKANAQGIKREIGFSEFSVKELIKADTDDLTQAIGNYSNNDLFAWGCYINGRLCLSSLENIQSNDIVEWKYEEKQ